MSDSPWQAIDPRYWREVPHLQGQLATPEDITQGRALFHLDPVQTSSQASDQTPTQTSARPAELTLPRCGLQRLEDGTLRPVVVIQAEVLGEQTLLGVRYLPGGGGICGLDEVQLVSGPEGWLPDALEEKAGEEDTEKND